MILDHFYSYSPKQNKTMSLGYFTNHPKVSLGIMSSTGKAFLFGATNDKYMTTRGNYKYFFPVHCLKESMI